MGLCQLQGAQRRASCRRLFLALPFSHFGLTLFRLEKQAARRGADNTATSLAQTTR
jgi:hypothetical protein